MTPPFDSQWTVPPSPASGDRPILGHRVAAGIVVPSILGYALLVVLFNWSGGVR